jgi:hypothetical protein
MAGPLTPLILFDPERDFSIEFPFFPEEIITNHHANWEKQNTSIGKKPLFYANSEGMTISLPEVYFDQTMAKVSLTPDIELLQYQVSEVEEGGPPPALVLVWGAQRIRCVLVDLTIRQRFFTEEGDPLRLLCSLELWELQEDGESVSVSEGSYDGPPFI